MQILASVVTPRNSRDGEWSAFGDTDGDTPPVSRSSRRESAAALRALQEHEAEASARVWHPVTFARIAEAPEKLCAAADHRHPRRASS